ncbi:MAG: hypothetical protein VX463_10655, partial [Pseudomonadota bacterium]|nr:hypothetical protein [Pseudomonadota bacterium]
MAVLVLTQLKAFLADWKAASAGGADAGGADADPDSITAQINSLRVLLLDRISEVGCALSSSTASLAGAASAVAASERVLLEFEDVSELLLQEARLAERDCVSIKLEHDRACAAQERVVAEKARHLQALRSALPREGDGGGGAEEAEERLASAAGGIGDRSESVLRHVKGALRAAAEATACEGAGGTGAAPAGLEHHLDGDEAVRNLGRAMDGAARGAGRGRVETGVGARPGPHRPPDREARAGESPAPAAAATPRRESRSSSAFVAYRRPSVSVQSLRQAVDAGGREARRPGSTPGGASADRTLRHRPSPTGAAGYGGGYATAQLVKFMSSGSLVHVHTNSA